MTETLSMPEINFRIAQAILALINSKPAIPTGSEIIHVIDTVHVELGIPRPGSPASYTPEEIGLMLEGERKACVAIIALGAREKWTPEMMIDEIKARGRD